MSALPFSLRTRQAAGRGEAGTSLIETLIAAGILLVIAVSIFPMFHRAVANNLSGADASQATQHDRSQLDGLLALPIDSPIFDMKNPQPGNTVSNDGTGDLMTIESLYWDDRANAQAPAYPDDPTVRLATGAWIPDPSLAAGLVIWQRTSVIRQYSYSDIGEGVIDVNNPNQITVAGHPLLFDSPLPRDAPDAEINFREEDVTMNSLRPGVPSLRTRFVRTY